MLKAVVFDRGGTLVRERPGEQVLHEILNPLGFHISPQDLARAEEASRDRWKGQYGSLPRGQRWNLDIRRDCLKAALESLKLPGDQDDLLIRLDTFWDSIRILGTYAGVRPCLSALAGSRIPMGVLAQTLRSSIEVRAELERLGVGRYFKAVLSVEDTPWDKPDPRTFQAIAERMGVSPSEVLFVGDDPEKDVEGARKAGMTPVLVVRRENATFEGVTVVQHLAQLPSLLPTLLTP